jgi:hypothetical protein
LLHNEELHGLIFFSNIVRMFMSRRMRWAGDVAVMGKKKKKNAYTISVGSHKERSHWDDLDIGGKIMGWLSD